MSILSTRLALLASDTRLGFRLISRKWKQVDRLKRKRIELGAVFSLLPLSAAIAALAAVPAVFELHPTQLQSVSEAVATPPIADQIEELVARDQNYVSETRTQRGETLAAMFSRLGISDAVALRFAQTDTGARPLVRMPPDRFVQASIAPDGRLQWLQVYGGGDAGRTSSSARVLKLERTTEAGFRVVEVDVPLERRVQLRTGDVRGSLFGATDAAEIPDAVTRQIIDALEGEIDLHRDLQRGARFRVIYEALYASGEYLRSGRLLAIEMENDGKRVAAYWFADGSRQGGFYSPDGRTLKQAFLRSALEYSRVSSGFSANRTHPVFGYDAAHRGTDYAAPVGNNVRSVAAGVVTFAGTQRGYGNVVEIQHDGKHATLYAHLEAIAPDLRQGVRIGQGESVGTVGATGYTTGPNLHFELKVQGIQVNALTADLPAAEPLAAAQLAKFQLATAPLRAQLALLERVDIALDRPR